MNVTAAVWPGHSRASLALTRCRGSGRPKGLLYDDGQAATQPLPQVQADQGVFVPDEEQPVGQSGIGTDHRR